MTIGRVLAAIGTGIVTLLVVAVAVIELLAFEFSAIVGVPIGLLAGVILAAIVAASFDGLTGPLRWVVAGVSGVGFGLLLALATSYVNIAEFEVTQTLVIGLVVGIFTGLGTVALDRSSGGF